MKNEKLLNAMGNIQDELIVNAMPGKAEQKPRRLRRGLAVALAAALVLALTVGAGAAGGVFGGLKDVFAPAFHYEETAPALDPEILEKLGRPVGASVTENGVTVTVESVIRDRYTCTIVTSVKMDGLDGNEVSYNWCEGDGILAGLGGAGGHSMDVTLGDDTIQLVRTWSSDSPIPAGKATVTISDIVLNQDRFLREKTIEGTWELEFDASYEDLSQDLPAGQTLTVEGVDVTLDEITISPLSIMIKYTADPAGADLNRMVEMEPFDETLESRVQHLGCIITQEDGTIFSNLFYEFDGNCCIDSGHSNAEEQDGLLKCVCAFRFSQMLPLDEIESITIEGVEIPLS